MSEDCLGARFEILVDGKTQYCRDTMLTVMGRRTSSRVKIPRAAWLCGICKLAN